MNDSVHHYEWDCPQCGNHITSLVPCERSAGAAPLNVDVLAEALHKSKIAGYDSVDFCGGDGWDDEVDHVGDAEAVATEYGRLLRREA